MKFNELLKEQLTVDSKQIKAVIGRLNQDLRLVNDYVKDVEQENITLKQNAEQGRLAQNVEQQKREKEEQKPRMKVSAPYSANATPQAEPSA